MDLIFKSKFEDMRGYKYNVAALAYAPFLMKNKGNSFSGYEMYQLDAMASHLNFNYNIIEPSDSPLGNLMSILCMDIQTSQWDWFPLLQKEKQVIDSSFPFYFEHTQICFRDS